MNIQTKKQLEYNFKHTVKNWPVHVTGGIHNGHTYTEHDLPWAIVCGDFTVDNAKSFVQELSNNMNIRVFLNKLIIKHEQNELHIAMDFDSEQFNGKDTEQNICSYSYNYLREKYIQNYGHAYLPENEKNIYGLYYS